ncbi:hypothetical protein [Dongia sp.]|uniref:hypothetical protein n=1 Tax=Dongia sp. TaxID=1977262 RepID=UPI0035AF40C8
MEHAEAFLLDQIPLALRSMVPTTLKTAYDAAAAAVKDEPIFNVPSAVDNRGRIIQWSVDLAFQRLVQSGKWPFDFRWREFERPTGRYLEILPSHSVVTISQVADPTKQPRDVAFRANKRLSGQGWLHGLPNPIEDEPIGVPHVLLLHGHQMLSFAHLAMPKGEHQSGFHYRSKNLMTMPHAVLEPETPVEDTDIEAVLELKEEIDKWRRDNAV